MTWVLDLALQNPWGICGDELLRPDGDRTIGALYVARASGRSNFRLSFGNGVYSYNFDIDPGDLVRDHVRQTYNLSDDIEIHVETPTYPWGYSDRAPSVSQFSYNTEEEALESASRTRVTPYIRQVPYRTDNPRYRSLFEVNWELEIDGITIPRSTVLTYTGDRVTLYTVNDFINFFALYFGVTSEEVPVTFWSTDPNFGPDNPPSYDCDMSYNATVIDIDGPSGPIEIDVDFAPRTGTIPADVTVTVIDGDPPSTSLENGDGSITISDAGNITMLNDGGTFFLYEFGNVGFYANGDASLTADNQVQLGVGQNSVTVENGSLTIRDETGSATLTAEDINRLKETLT